MAANLDGLKAFLRVTHDEDDDALQILLDAAERDALEFADVSELPDSPTVDVAVYMTARAMYDATSPADAEKWRDVARMLLWPYREGLGT